MKVDDPIAEYLLASQKWYLAKTLLGGRSAMIEAGKDFLPQEPGETDAGYMARLERTFLFNGYSFALASLTGKVFSKPVKIESTGIVEEIIEDVDRCGTGLTEFGRKVFLKGLGFGVFHILVDMPQLQEGSTLADDRERGVRPYFVHIKPEQLIGWRMENNELTQIRIKETITEPDGEFGEKTYAQVRVIEKDVWRTYQKSIENKDEYLEVAAGINGLGKVPLVSCVLKGDSKMVGESPLQDLADLNLRHWQSSSDQNNILHVVRVPRLFGAGFTQEEKEEMIKDHAVSSFVVAGEENAKLAWVEHSGEGISSGQEDLTKIEEKMSLMALEPLLPKTTDSTATGRMIDAANAQSALQAWSRAFGNCMTEALEIAKEWVNDSSDFELEVNEDFGLTDRDIETLQLLKDTFIAGGLTGETMLKEFKRKGALSDEVDVDQELSSLEDSQLPDVV